MKPLRRIIPVLFVTSLIIWPTSCRHPLSPLTNQPADLAQKLYANVIAHPTSGIPSGDDWKIFAPFLGKSLLQKIDIYNACIADEERYYAALKGPPVKLASLAEFGIFSGGDEKEAPGTAKVESSQPQKDGSVRVTVKLGLPQYEMEWRVIDVFVREDDHFVLEDVVFPGEFFIKGIKDDRPPGPDEYLSHDLTEICKGGTHWSPVRNLVLPPTAKEYSKLAAAWFPPRNPSNSTRSSSASADTANSTSTTANQFFPPTP